MLQKGAAVGALVVVGTAASGSATAVGDSPTNKEACKSGGWKNYGFRNQGQCIRYVNTGKDSRNKHKKREGKKGHKPRQKCGKGKGYKKGKGKK